MFQEAQNIRKELQQELRQNYTFIVPFDSTNEYKVVPPNNVPPPKNLPNFNLLPNQNPPTPPIPFVPDILPETTPFSSPVSTPPSTPVIPKKISINKLNPLPNAFSISKTHVLINQSMMLSKEKTLVANPLQAQMVICFVT